MHDCYSFHEGTSPLIISVPHDGRIVPDNIALRMTAEGRAIPDTDWHVARLYEFGMSAGASMIVANYSRYVVDLNRSPGDDAPYPDRVSTGLCPSHTFSGAAIYLEGTGVTDAEMHERVRDYWQPYHNCLIDELTRLVREYGYALLWDAHSIPSKVPRLFDGELPVLSIGTNDGASCGSDLEQAVAEIANRSDYETVVNARFKGGYITRHYGSPADGVHAMQLEIAQRAYMDETSGRYVPDSAARLQKTVKQMLDAFTIQAALRQRE